MCARYSYLWIKCTREKLHYGLFAVLRFLSESAQWRQLHRGHIEEETTERQLCRCQEGELQCENEYLTSLFCFFNGVLICLTSASSFIHSPVVLLYIEFFIIFRSYLVLFLSPSPFLNDHIPNRMYFRLNTIRFQHHSIVEIIIYSMTQNTNEWIHSNNKTLALQQISDDSLKNLPKVAHCLSFHQSDFCEINCARIRGEFKWKKREGRSKSLRFSNI